MNKIMVGLIEKIRVLGNKKSVTTLAKFDTGATGNSIDIRLAGKAGLLIVSTTKVKHANIKGFKRRPVVDVVLDIKGKKYKTRANVEDRTHMAYKVLIGRKLILSNFIVDVSQTNISHIDVDLKPKVRKKFGKFAKGLKNG